MSQRVLVGGYTADMTPELPVRLAGYSARTRPADEQAEPLLVTTVTVKTDAARIVLIGADCVGLDASVAGPLRRRAAKIADTEAAHVHICASHTHFGPVLSPFRFLDPTLMIVEPEEGAVRRFREAVEHAVARAIERETAADMDWFTVPVAGFSFNRRFRRETGETETHFRYPQSQADLAEQPIDDRMTVITFRRASYVVATLIHLACHPVCGAEDGQYVVSSDYVHHLRRTVTGELEGPVLFLQGAAGDVVPARRGGASRRLIGGGLGSAVLANTPRLSRAYDVPVRTARETLALAVPSTYAGNDLDDALAKAAAASESSDTSTPEGLHYWKLLSAAFFRRIYPDGIMRIDLSAVRIGPLDLVFLPFEILSSLSLEVRAAAESARIVSCADGYQGYLPSEEETRSGGYEGRPGTRHVDDESRTRIVHTMYSLLERLAESN